MIKFTHIEMKSPRKGGKHYDLVDGKLTKSTVGHINRAQAFVLEVENLKEFGHHIRDEVRPGQDVFAFGVPVLDVPDGGVKVRSEKIYSKLSSDEKKNTICRSEKYFAWGTGPAVLFGDYDPRGGETAMSPEAILQRLFVAAPLLKYHDILWGASSSSYIYDDFFGDELSGLKGQRFYLAVEDGSDIPRATEVLVKRMWLAGDGYILISGNGTRLRRALFDTCVWQASRLDYAGGAVCGEDLEQRRPDNHLINTGGALIDSREVFPDLTAEEEAEYQRVYNAALAAQLEAAETQFELWLDRRIEDEARVAVGNKKNKIQAKIRELEKVGRRQALSKVATDERAVLDADLVLHLNDGTMATVREVLSGDFDGTNCADPLEPDYGDGRATAKIYTYSRRLVSHAHGIQKTYILATDDEYRAIWNTRAAEISRGWKRAIADIGDDVLSCGAVDVAIALEDNEEAMEALEAAARAQKVKTTWQRAINKRKKIFNIEPREERQVDAAELRIDVNNPNYVVQDRCQLEDTLAKKRLAFNLGGLNVVVQKHRSAIATTRVRDKIGDVVIGDDGAEVRVPVEHAVCVAIRRGHMVSLLHTAAYFERLSENRSIPVVAPDYLISALMDTQGGRLPLLRGVASHPVWFNGELLSGSGYHEASALWLETGETGITPWDDPVQAYHWLLEEWLSDFNFEDEKSAAAAVMHLATLLTAKTSLMGEAGPPMFFVTAPSAGIGKSLLVDAIHMAVTGRSAATTALPEDGEERKKLITATIIESTLALNFDNLKTGSTMGNSYTEILQLITTGNWSGRVLGVSNTFSGPAGVVLSATGNNVARAGDMGSRSYECRLVPRPGENLALRDFKHRDILKWTRDHRGEILGAMAAIMSIKAKAKYPGRFPKWASVVAGPVLEVSGVTSFFDDWIQASDEDVNNAFVPDGMLEFLTTVACMPTPEGTIQKATGTWYTANELLEANSLHVFDRMFSGSLPNPQSLTGYLRRHRDIVVDGKYAIRASQKNLGGRTGRKTRWVFKVERLTDDKLPDGKAKVIKL